MVSHFITEKLFNVSQWFERTNGWVHDEHNIKGFFDQYRYLSNFHECPVMYEGILYPSSEAAYQAAKTTDLEIRKTFTTMTPTETKKAGRQLELREGWDDMKVKVMAEILLDKFTRNEDLKEKLISTGDKYLEETNWWRDVFWGVCNGMGRNELGQVLMAIREVLKNE